MSIKPILSPFSEVLDPNRRWTPDWYSWLGDLQVQANKADNFIPGDLSIFNFTQFGGLANNNQASAAINSQAIADGVGAAVTAGGGILQFPPGIIYANSQILINDSSVHLWGSGKRVTTIRAASGFPINTSLLRWGTVFDSTVQDIGLDCNYIAGSIGVYSNGANEGCGLFRVAVANSLDTGIFYDTGCEHFNNEDIEVLLSNASSNYGIRLGSGTGGAGITPFFRTTIVGAGQLPGTTIAGVWVDGSSESGAVVMFTDLHLEFMTTGIKIDGDAVYGTINFVDGELIPTLIHFTGLSPVVILQAINFFGANNILVDDASGLTIPNSENPLAIWSRKPLFDVRTITTTVTTSPYTVLDSDLALIVNNAGTVGLTLPDPALNLGRIIYIKTLQSQAVDSIAADVVSLRSATPDGFILPPAAGAWAFIQSDGANWQITAQSDPFVTTQFISSSPYTIDIYDSIIQNNAAGTLTVTLPNATTYRGRRLTFISVGNAVISASANVAPLGGGGASTAIVAATSGKYTTIQADGPLWRVVAAN
jgi:hypothetical protein